MLLDELGYVGKGEKSATTMTAGPVKPVSLALVVSGGGVYLSKAIKSVRICTTIGLGGESCFLTFLERGGTSGKK